MMSTGTGGVKSLIAIGSSTGGVEALYAILTCLPREMPPIVIAQHIPAVFSAEFAKRLDQTCRIRVKEAADGDAIRPGWALIAPGNFHLTIRGSGDGWRAVVAGGERVQYQRPSVDVLFESVARHGGAGAVGVLLTGMGADGAAGMLSMKKAGAYTIAQDEASCVVFGMPREAIRLGGVDSVLPLDRIGQALSRYSCAPRSENWAKAPKATGPSRSA